MSSPLCANSSRDFSSAELRIGPVAQVESDRQVGTGVEVMCFQLEVKGPVVVVDSGPAIVGRVVRGPVVELGGVEAMEVLFLVVQVVPVNGSEVRCSVGKSVFFAILSAASVIHVVPGGKVPEVKVGVVELIGPVVKVGASVLDPVVEATDSEL